MSFLIHENAISLVAYYSEIPAIIKLRKIFPRVSFTRAISKYKLPFLKSLVLESCREGNLETLKVLHEEFAVELPFKSLPYAIEGKNREIIFYLLSQGQKLDFYSIDIAYREGDMQLLQELLSIFNKR